MDFLNKHGFIYNPDDDTLTRLSHPRTTTEAHNSLPNQTIFTQDISLNPTHNTWFRLYRPITPPPPHTKLPLILYIHGGGFIMCTAFDTFSHDFCTSLATELPAVILSLEYRLAPENRLPAAYDDAVEALLWIKNQALSDIESHALKDFVDFSKCYLMGSSAGGNIAYHAGLRAMCLELEPLVIRGCILDHPFFTGLERSESELRLANGLLSLDFCDLCAELSLPKGCDRDHEYLNPLVDGSYKDKIGMLGRCFVNTHSGDLLVDYGMEFGKMLKRNGVSVVTRFQEGGCHCLEIDQPDTDAAKALFVAVKEFVSA